MNKSYIFVLFLLCFCQSIKGQETNGVNERIGNVYFTISSDYRITPFYSGSSSNDEGSSVDIDQQNSGYSLNYEFNYFILHNFSLGFSHSFRYDQITKGTAPLTNETPLIANDSYGLLMDFHFSLKYYLKISSSSELILLAGRSLLNNGSSYSTIRPVFDINDELIVNVATTRNSTFGSFNFGVGWKKNRIEVLGGIYTSNTTNFFEGSTAFSIPYVRFNYILGKL